MKTLLLVATLFFSISIGAQATIDSINKTIYLKQVHEVEGSQKDLKKKAEVWMAKTYNNSKYVTRLSDEKQILGKGGFTFPVTY